MTDTTPPWLLTSLGHGLDGGDDPCQVINFVRIDSDQALPESVTGQFTVGDQPTDGPLRAVEPLRGCGQGYKTSGRCLRCAAPLVFHCFRPSGVSGPARCVSPKSHVPGRVRLDTRTLTAAYATRFSYSLPIRPNAPRGHETLVRSSDDVHGSGEPGNLSPPVALRGNPFPWAYAAPQEPGKRSPASLRRLRLRDHVVGVQVTEREVERGATDLGGETAPLQVID